MKNKKQIKKCIKLEELLKAEIPALKEATLHRMNLLEKEKHMKVPYHMAEKDFMNRFLNAWGEGYKQCYCAFVCTERDNCQIGYDNLNRYTDFYDGKNE